MAEEPALSVAEWLVLAVVSEGPTHGFAIAALTAPQGYLGRVWRVPRPVIYRSLGRLADAGLVVPTGTEAGKGPQRTVYAVSDHGRKTVAAWLDAPVWHIRDVRSQLLIKLALRARIGADPSGLLRRQRDILEPIVEALDEELGAAGEEPGTAGEEPKARDAGQASSDEAPAPPDDFEATLQAWRRAMARSALYFVNEIGRPRA